MNALHLCGIPFAIIHKKSLGGGTATNLFRLRDCHGKLEIFFAMTQKDIAESPTTPKRDNAQNN